VPIDRAAILRSAERLLQQGKLESAIAEYRRIVDEQPEDWTTANILGDLDSRAGQNDKAVAQFVRIADHLQRQGFLPKAAALCKNVLRIRPDDDHALAQAGEIAASQLLLVDANAYLKSASERRSARGDHPGAAEIRARHGSLDAKDFEASRAAAERQRGAAAFPEHPIESTSAEPLTLAQASEPSGTTQRTFEEPVLDGVSGTEPDSFELSAMTVDLNLDEAVGDVERWLDEHVQQKVEVDLTVMLDNVKSKALPPFEHPAPDEAGGEDLDIDQVFAQLRDKASGGTSEAAEQEYARGVALYEAGEVTDGIRALEPASRSPIHRFRAAAALGRIYRDHGAMSQAIDWFERAAGAPAPSAEDGHALFYELAVSLESIRAVERALAVCLELQAEAGDYRDVSARISRLTKAQARG
jgi:tetratricopeptide (TPR) repeat protein